MGEEEREREGDVRPPAGGGAISLGIQQGLQQLYHRVSNRPYGGRPIENFYGKAIENAY